MDISKDHFERACKFSDMSYEARQGMYKLLKERGIDDLQNSSQTDYDMRELLHKLITDYKCQEFDKWQQNRPKDA